MKTRRKMLELHDNDYGFDTRTALAERDIDGGYPEVSVVIPYYETGEVFSRCLNFLSNAIEKYPGDVRVIVVDDGSVRRPLMDYVSPESWLECIVLPVNRGRTEARNKGLSQAKSPILLFMDSDIMIDEQLIANHVKLHMTAMKSHKKAICISFFDFAGLDDKRILGQRLTTGDLRLNDFRLECTYGATWIGCEEDMQYVGQHIELIKETDDLRSWKGQYKAWMLPNMVLGGAFSVQRDEILAVEGFDSRFQGYGFTETSAVTRMVAERSNVVIPCLAGGAIHIDDDSVNVSRGEKDRIFMEKHDFYFNTFLEEEVL